MRALVLLGLFLYSSSAFAQKTDHCTKILDSGLREYSVKQSNRTYLNQIHDKYCEGKSLKAGFETSGGASVPIQGIPVQFTGRLGGKKEKMSNFCRDYDETKLSIEDTFEYQEKIVSRAFDSFDRCVQLESEKITISHQFHTLKRLTIYVQARVGAPVYIRGLELDNAECYVIKGNERHDFKSIETLEIKDSAAIFCSRKGIEHPDGRTEYADSVIQADILTQDFSLVWSGATEFAQLTTAEILKKIDAVQSKFEPTTLYVCPEKKDTVAGSSSGWASFGCLGQISSQKQCRNTTFVHHTVGFKDTLFDCAPTVVFRPKQ